jgi:hypothetical protein
MFEQARGVQIRRPERYVFEQTSMRGSSLPLRIAVSIVAILVAAVHIWRPDIKIDSITIVLLVIAVIPWTQPLLKSIELLGVKLELQELQEKVDVAKGAAESASQQAGLALSASSVSSSPSSRAAAAPLDILSLAREYNEIRSSQRSGDARTAAMTDVVRRMIQAVAGTETFNVNETLRDDDGGRRLLAYVFLYAKPDERHLVPLIESVTKKEDKPFGQYWGLQAIGRVLSRTETVPPQAAKMLRAYSTTIPPGTDRDYELRKLLQQLANR